MIKKHSRIGVAVLAVFALTALALVACGDDDDDSGGITISDASARFPAGTSGAVYFLIDNHGKTDALLSASTDAAGMAQLHHSVTNNGTSQMEQLNQIDVPADAHVQLEPGGMHVMLMNVDTAPEVGDHHCRRSDIPGHGHHHRRSAGGRPR